MIKHVQIRGFFCREVSSKELDHFFLASAAAIPPAISPTPAAAMPIPMAPSKLTPKRGEEWLVFCSTQRQ
jgi:hypothetical protein